MLALPVVAALTVTIAALAAPPPNPAATAAPSTDVRSTRVRLSTGVSLEVAERGAPATFRSSSLSGSIICQL